MAERSGKTFVISYRKWRSAFFTLFAFFVTTAFSQGPQLSITTGHSDKVTSLCFSESGRILASGGADGNILLWDVKSGRQIKILSADGLAPTLAMCFGRNDTILYSADIFQLHRWNILTGKELTQVQGEAPLLPIGLSFTGEMIEQLTFFNDHLIVCSTHTIAVYESDLSGKSIIGEIRNNFSSFSSDCKKLLTIEDVSVLNDIYSDDGAVAIGVYDVGTNLTSLKLINRTKSGRFADNITSAFFSATADSIYGRTSSGELYLSVKNHSGNYSSFILLDNPSSTVMLQDEKHFELQQGSFVSGDAVFSFSETSLLRYKKNGKLDMIFPSHPFPITQILVNEKNGIVVSADNVGNLFLWNMETGKEVRSFLVNNQLMNKIKFNANGTILYIAYVNGTLKQWDLKNNKIKKVSVVSEKIFTRPENRLVITAIEKVLADSVLYFTYKLKTKKYCDTYSATWNIRTNEIRSVNKGREENTQTASDFLNAELTTSVTEEDYSFSFKSRSVTCRIGGVQTSLITGHSGRITDVKLWPDKKIVCTASFDGMIKFWDLETKKELFSCGILNDVGYYYCLPERYYYASKQALNKLSFCIQDKVYPIEQFDLTYNRPDKVEAVLPFADERTKNLYKKIYEKRMVSANTNNLSSTTSFPDLTLLSKIPVTTSEDEISIDVRASDKEVNISSVTFAVNGVPVSELSGTGAMILNGTKTIKLTTGINIITVVANNTSGISSLKEEFEITCTKKHRSDLYVITIGSGEFIQSTYDLKYAPKDAGDINRFFSKEFKNVFTKMYLNKEVTRNILPEIGQFLASAKEDDKVLLFYSGHGLLDQQLNYYLSTYPIDFTNPQLEGIRYDDLEALLKKIPSRKKVLFLDACHGGEIDKSSVLQVIDTISHSNDQKIVFRSGTTTLTSTESPEYKNAFEVSRILFADISQTSGVTVISSSSGTEFAMESDKWHNGVFTYALLNGLRSHKADTDRDGTIYLSELQEYINQTVVELTKGAQTPTGRVENLKNDFSIK
jgi:WD40 repeat protein